MNWSSILFEEIRGNVKELSTIKEVYWVGNYDWTKTYNKDIDINIVLKLTKDIEQYTKEELEILIDTAIDQIITFVDPDESYHTTVPGNSNYAVCRNHRFVYYEFADKFINKIVFRKNGLIFDVWFVLKQDQTENSWVSNDDWKARTLIVKTLKEVIE